MQISGIFLLEPTPKTKEANSCLPTLNIIKATIRITNTLLALPTRCVDIGRVMLMKRKPTTWTIDGRYPRIGHQDCRLILKKYGLRKNDAHSHRWIFSNYSMCAFLIIFRCANNIFKRLEYKKHVMYHCLIRGNTPYKLTKHLLPHITNSYNYGRQKLSSRIHTLW